MMPIQPIDLQNMFLRLNQIGKEQAEQRETIAQQQSAQNSAFVRETEHKDHSVNQATDVPDGPNKTDEDGGKKQRQEQNEEKNTTQENPTDKEKSILEDPDLGHHVDISG
jgi:hypothetical protein